MSIEKRAQRPTLQDVAQNARETQGGRTISICGEVALPHALEVAVSRGGSIVVDYRGNILTQRKGGEKKPGREPRPIDPDAAQAVTRVAGAKARLEDHSGALIDLAQLVANGGESVLHTVKKSS